METRMNRRRWLKSSALLAGGASLLPLGAEALGAARPALAPLALLALPAWLPLTEQEALSPKSWPTSNLRP